MTRSRLEKVSLAEPCELKNQESLAFMREEFANPAIATAPWAHHPVRDIEVSPLEAFAYLRWLRARAGAHDVTKLGYLLSVHDVANAQLLARRLIINIAMEKSRTARHSEV